MMKWNFESNGKLFELEILDSYHEKLRDIFIEMKGRGKKYQINNSDDIFDLSFGDSKIIEGNCILKDGKYLCYNVKCNIKD